MLQRINALKLKFESEASQIEIEEKMSKTSDSDLTWKETDSDFFLD